jgi:hypothetical protein
LPITRSGPLRPGATGEATATGGDCGGGGGRFIGGKLDTASQHHNLLNAARADRRYHAAACDLEHTRIDA